MSDLYIRKLGRIRDEYRAAAGALAYVSVYWHKQNIFNFGGLEASSLEEIKRAADNLEATFLIRVFSAFEGVLKEHLATYHARGKVADDVSAAWLIDRVSNLQRPRINLQLRQQVHTVRRYRNHLVHRGSSMPATVEFSEALARLTKFVHRLP